MAVRLKRKILKMLNYTSVAKNKTPAGDLGTEDNNSHLVILNCVLNAPLMLMSITGNALVLTAILRTPSLRSPSTVFLCSLAVSDLLVGLVVQPVLLVRLFKASGYIVDAYQDLALSVGGVTLLTMAAISVDRFLALHYHMRYPNLMTQKRAIFSSVAIWFTCFVFSGIYVLNQKIVFSTAFVFIALCVFVSTFSYIKIYRTVRRHQLQIYAQQQAVERLNNEHNLNMLQSKKIAMNTFIYYICMVLCYSPVFMSAFTLAIFPQRWSITWTFTDTVAFTNSSINPFLYCWRTRELRTAVSKTIRIFLCKQTEGN